MNRRPELRHAVFEPSFFMPMPPSAASLFCFEFAGLPVRPLCFVSNSRASQCVLFVSSVRAFMRAGSPSFTAIASQLPHTPRHPPTHGDDPPNHSRKPPPQYAADGSTIATACAMLLKCNKKHIPDIPYHMP